MDIKNNRLKYFENFKMASEIYRKFFLYIALIQIFAFVPVNVVATLVPTTVWENLIKMTPSNISSMYSEITWLYFLVAVYLVFMPLSTSALARISFIHTEGREVSVSEILDSSLAQWHKLILTTFIVAFITLFSSFLIIAPIYFFIVFLFVNHITATTGIYGFRSMMASSFLVKNNFFRTLAFIISINIIQLAITALINNIIFASFGDVNVFLQIVISLLVQIAVAYFQILTAVYFLNLYYVKNLAGGVK